MELRIKKMITEKDKMNIRYGYKIESTENEKFYTSFFKKIQKTKNAKGMIKKRYFRALWNSADYQSNADFYFSVLRLYLPEFYK